MLGTILNTYKKIFKLLDKSILGQFWRMQGLILITSIIDLFGLATFIPVLSAVANPEIIDKNRFFIFLKETSGINDNNKFLLLLFIAAFVFFILRSAFVLFSQWIQNKFVFQLSEHIGEKTYRYYLNMSFLEFRKRNSAEIIRELTVSPNHFSKFLVMPLLLLLTEMLMIFMIIGGIALYDFKVFILLVVTIFPVIFIFQRLVKKKMRFFGEEQNRETPKLYSNSNRGIYGFIDVKLRSKENVLVNDYTEVLKKLNIINIKTSTLTIFPAKLFEMVTVGGLLIIFIYATYLADNPQLVIPLIALYAAAGYRIIPSLSKVIPAMMQLEQFSYLLDVYDEPLKQEANKKDINETSMVSFNNEISFNDVSFKYSVNENLLLKNINLRIKKGEIIGIIGKSGSGKTTLVNMITGFLKPLKGEIKIDEEVLSKKNIKNWMNQISYVQQSPYLERGSLASNIAFLDEKPDAQKLNKVIQMASLSDFVGTHNPFDLVIDEEGKNLSGGQKQRVCIARALYHNSKLIIFDEATSALDNQTENEVNETILNLKGTGVTIIIIAHRYSTLKYTDRIIEMDSSEIKQTTYLRLSELNQ